MANFVYKKAKEAILNGEFNFSSNNFKILFLKNTYSPNENIHEFVSDIGSSNISYRSPEIQNITNTLGVIDADNLTLSLPANTSFHSIVFYQLGINDSNSRLLFYIDDSDGLPFPGSLQPITVVFNWSNEVSKILSI
jgi:hypothetical protein